MTNYSATLDLRGALAVPCQCPACRSAGLAAVCDADVTNFLCEVCGLCWHVDLGRAAQADPRACSTCPRQPQCLARMEEA
jgi:hypothetical protein